MRTTPSIAITALLILLSVSSCSIFGGAAPPTIHYYRLDYERTEGERPALPVVLRTMPLAAAPMYDGHRIVVREGVHELGSYHYRRWSTDPAKMIGALIQRDLADSGSFRAVIDGVAPTASDYSISGTVEEVEQRVDRGCTAHLRTRFLLTGPSRDGTLFQKPYQATEPCESNSVEDFVAAMSRAVAAISTRLRVDIETAIRRDRGELSENLP